MRCEDALNLVNARADGELTNADAAALDVHLAACARCQAAADGFAAIDAELREAFTPRREAALRVAESAVAAMHTSTAGVETEAARPDAPAAARVPRIAWVQVLFALAAGFLLALLVFRPWQDRSSEPIAAAPFEPVARLTVASNPVDVCLAGDLAVFKCAASSPLERDSIVRTGPTERCEISLADGGAVRLDCNTEIRLRESEGVEMSRGRIFASSRPDGKGIEIQSAGGTIVSHPASQVAVDCQPRAARLIVLRGAANVRTAQNAVEVGPGQQARISQGKVELEGESRDALLETAWVNNVLALHSSDHPELVERVRQLLSSIGAAKLSLLYEDELRRLGDEGVPPLLAYLATTRDAPQTPQRATAARIVADVAETRWVADLIGLLTDANADVRFHAARGLERLTGRNQGCEARTWQTETWVTCESPYQKWLAWWTENRDRYPPAHRELSTPTAPPF